MPAKWKGLSVNVKLGAIKKIKQRATQISIANQQDVGASIVRGWLKKEPN